MSGRNSATLELNKLQIKADIVVADSTLQQAKQSKPKLAKYLKGQVGYHLQQAAEKLIKIQIYKSGVPVDNAKLYKHDLQYIINYAASKNITLIIPDYVLKNAMVISSWEAEGRYDVHIVVKFTQLEKAYAVISEWYKQMEKSL